MKNKNILITGGAGFIGSHLADALLALNHQVTVLDLLHPQVHGEKQAKPAYLDPRVTLLRHDVRDKVALQNALADKDVIYHFAAYTGVGQSMYQINEYLDVNVLGTAVLMEILSQTKHQVQKVILASSRAVYGEGAYRCQQCGVIHPAPRPIAQLRAGLWEVVCPNCGQNVVPMPTAESTTPNPHSVYAISKLNQEQIGLLIGDTYRIPVVVLRYFNVYGPRQSLSNPYTGVISTFITRLMNGRPLQVYEDGQESRDFVHVQDVVQACVLAMGNQKAAGQVINVGSGKALTLLEIAQIITNKFNGPAPIISGQYRAGDIRHCFADLTQARNLLGYIPKVSFEDGIDSLLADLAGQRWQDLSDRAEKELIEHGLAADKL